MSNDSLSGPAGLGTSELSRQATREELAEHNARVRRLAKDYARKYRPLVLSLGYHVNLAEGLGRTYIGVQRIIKESARYTASGKPLQDRYVKRLLAEMLKAGALKAEDRWSEDTGHRQTSYRTLVTSLSMDRHGFTRAHDFWAPLSDTAESSQVDEKKDTIQDTIQNTIGDTIQDTQTVLELPENWQETSHHQEPGDDGRQEDPENQDQGQNQGPSAPRPAGADEVPGDKPFQFSSEGRENWAGHLDVPLSSIRESFWTWFGHAVNEMQDKAYDGCQHGCYNVSPCQCTHSDECDRTDEGCTCPCPASGTADCACPCPASGSADKCECRCEHDDYFETGIRAATKAAKGASVKENPVGYFQTVVMQQIEVALHRSMSRADAECQRQAEEVGNARQRKQEEALQARLQRAQDELDEILPELAELRFGGDIDAARDDIAIWGDPRNQLEKARMYLARSRAGIGRVA